jgi:hypothetical protein
VVVRRTQKDDGRQPHMRVGSLTAINTGSTRTTPCSYRMRAHADGSNLLPHSAGPTSQRVLGSCTWRRNLPRVRGLPGPARHRGPRVSVSVRSRLASAPSLSLSLGCIVFHGRAIRCARAPTVVPIPEI